MAILFIFVQPFFSAQIMRHNIAPYLVIVNCNLGIWADNQTSTSDMGCLMASHIDFSTCLVVPMHLKHRNGNKGRQVVRQ